MSEHRKILKEFGWDTTKEIPGTLDDIVNTISTTAVNMAIEIIRLREESKIWSKVSLVQMVNDLGDERAYSEKLREALKTIKDEDVYGGICEFSHVDDASKALALPRPGSEK